MDKKQLTDIEQEAIKDAGAFGITFGVAFAVLAEPALSAGNVATEKALIVSAAIAGASQAFAKTKPLWAKLGTDLVASIVNRSKAPAAPSQMLAAAPAPIATVTTTAAPVTE